MIDSYVYEKWINGLWSKLIEIWYYFNEMILWYDDIMWIEIRYHIEMSSNWYFHY